MDKRIAYVLHGLGAAIGGAAFAYAGTLLNDTATVQAFLVAAHCPPAAIPLVMAMIPTVIAKFMQSPVPTPPAK